jgi:hypothetical protein
MKYSRPLERDMSDWEPEPRVEKVNYEELCQKLQNALAKSYVDSENHAKELEYLTCLLSIKRKRIEHLEGCLAFAISHGEFDLTNEEEDEESLSEYLKARQ